MDPKSFLALTEATLLTEVGECIQGFFKTPMTQYTPLLDRTEVGLHRKETISNPRSAILPLAQVNMVANVSFHLMAQQLAILFYSRPEISRNAVFETTWENVRKLTLNYLNTMKEAENVTQQTHGEGPAGGPASSG